MRRYCKVDRVNGTKECPDCHAVKPLEAFPVRSSGTVYSYCKECNVRRAVDWSSKNRERKTLSERERQKRDPEKETAKRRSAHYKRRYGVGLEEVHALLEKQSFMCAICGAGLTIDSLVLDHCHSGGGVRGILCNLCNISLGPIERPGFLAAALAYIESHRSGS